MFTRLFRQMPSGEVATRSLFPYRITPVRSRAMKPTNKKREIYLLEFSICFENTER